MWQKSNETDFSFTKVFIFEVKTSLAAFGREKIYELALSWRYSARIN